MNRIVTAIAIVAATAAASRAVRKLLEREPRARRARPAIESWENEGGALAPQHASVETSQVPR